MKIEVPGKIGVTSWNRVRSVYDCEQLEKLLEQNLIDGNWYYKVVSATVDGFDVRYTFITEAEAKSAVSLPHKGIVHFEEQKERGRKQYRLTHTLSGVYIVRHKLVLLPIILNKDNPEVPTILVPFRGLEWRAIDKPLQAKREKKLDRERAGGSLF